MDEIDLTYTQYIAMMVLWERKVVTVKEMGELLYLDSGTLTPLLKKLEIKGLLTRTRKAEDERNLNVMITQKGEKLKEEAVKVQISMEECSGISTSEAAILYQILYRILGR